MGAVTYPNAQVAEFVSERFVAIKFNVKEPHPDFKEALGRGKVLWAPLLVFLDGRGSELRRYVGFLPPDEFLAEPPARARARRDDPCEFRGGPALV